MGQISTGFWGAFLGASALILVASLLAYRRSLHKMAFNAVLSVLASVVFVLAFLGALPIDDANTLACVLAHVQCVVSAFLAYQLFALSGLLRQRPVQFQVIAILMLITVLAVGEGWLLMPLQSLGISTAMACLMGLLAIAVSLRSIFKGKRFALRTFAEVSFLQISMLGLNWIALDRENVPWQVHELSAIAGIAFMAILASMLWARYVDLMALDEVRAHSSSYDPITRMRSRSATNHMVVAAFEVYREQPEPFGVIVVSIANIIALERLYGHEAVNHALLVCAGRLRRTVPSDVAMGRLADESFLLLVRNGHDSGRLIDLARAIQTRLFQSVSLNIGLDAAYMQNKQIGWQAQVGVGIVKVDEANADGATIVAKALRISRTAWAYPSRVAWLDGKSGGIVGVPVL